MSDIPKLLKTVPTAFISYSRESDEHKAWVVELGTRLRTDGIDLTLDEWHLRPGDELPRFMEEDIRDADFVNAAQRVSEAITNRRILSRGDNPLARLKLEREIEPEQKKQVQRVMDLLQRIKLFASDDTQTAANKIAELAVVWQLTVWHPDGDNLFDQQYRQFIEEALPAFRAAARRDLDQT